MANLCAALPQLHIKIHKKEFLNFSSTLRTATAFYGYIHVICLANRAKTTQSLPFTRTQMLWLNSNLHITYLSMCMCVCALLFYMPTHVNLCHAMVFRGVHRCLFARLPLRVGYLLRIRHGALRQNNFSCVHEEFLWHEFLNLNTIIS